MMGSLANKCAGSLIGCVILLDGTVRFAKDPTYSLRMENHNAPLR